MRPHLELHLAVLLYGLTAVLGEALTLSALPLVWWRVGLASVSFGVLAALSRSSTRLTRPLALRLAGIGVIVALHWVTFYGSVKLANASVALVAFASSSLFTALLEPWLRRAPVNWLDVGLGGLVIPGMLLVAGAVAPAYYPGLAVGLLSALLASAFSVLNKRYVAEVRPLDLAGVEMVAAFAFLSLAYPALARFDMGAPRFWPQAADWPLLAVLVLGCTTLAYLLTVRSLRQLSAFATTLAVGLEPVYGILLAAVLLGQYASLDPGFYLGSALITAAVLAHPLIRRARWRRAALNSGTLAPAPHPRSLS